MPWPALGPPTRTLITCCPFCRAWRIVWSVAWPLPSEPYCAPVITLRVLIWVFLLSVGCCYFYFIIRSDLRSSKWVFVTPCYYTSLHEILGCSCGDLRVVVHLPYGPSAMATQDSAHA